MSNTITCPKCKTAIKIDEVMSAQLTDEIRQELQTEYDAKAVTLAEDREAVAKQRRELEAQKQAMDEQVRKQVEQEKAALLEKARRQAEESVAVELKDRDEQIKDFQTKLKTATDKELAWRKKERELTDREDRLRQQQEEMQDQIKQKLADERQKLVEQAKKSAREELAADLKDRDDRVADLKAKLKKAGETELELRKKERDLQEKTEQLELEVARRIETERDQIRQNARKQADAEHQLKDAEKDKKISDLVKQLDELKRKAEQGSQQTQGEVMELAFEERLRETFRDDQIVEVPKGVSGADILQRVRTSGVECGSILWEIKRTKNWSAQWLPKLRDDQRAAKSEIAILVTATMPEGTDHFAQIDGVWVCNWSCATGVAAALRAGLVEVAKARRALEGQHGKMEQIYNYLASAQFRNRVSGIVESFATMKQDLDAEKKAIQKHWAKREKQIEQAIVSTAGMYGDFQGIIGSTLPEIEGMSLQQLEAGN